MEIGQCHALAICASCKAHCVWDLQGMRDAGSNPRGTIYFPIMVYRADLEV